MADEDAVNDQSATIDETSDETQDSDAVETGPDGISAELHAELLASHPEFVGNWAHLARFHALVREKRYHHDQLAAWNDWRQEQATVDLRGAVAHKGNLRECDLHGADLRGARLSEALMGKADLRDADCRGTAFRGADMVETRLTGARFAGADFRWVRRTTQEQFAGTSGDAETILPEGIERPADWA